MVIEGAGGTIPLEIMLDRQFVIYALLQSAFVYHNRLLGIVWINLLVDDLVSELD